MKTCSLLLLLVFSYSAHSATYYLSANSGDDSRGADEAQNPSTPWKSLSKLNSFFSSLQPGDQVLLKRGETFYGSILVNKSGTAGSPIFIGAYGSGDKPVITSLVTLSNWVSKGGGIWESYNSSLPAKLNMVLVNGAEKEMGRFPNSDAENKGYLNFDSHIGTASISYSNLDSKPDFTGAEMVIRVRRWVIDRDLITHHSGTKITYSKSSNYEPRDGYGFFIQNSIKTLDKAGEWYYNPANNKLSVYFGSNGPSSYTVQAATKQNIIYAQKFSNVIFDNLEMEGSNASGVAIKYGSNINIENCDIRFSGANGVQAFYHDYFKIENSTVGHSNYGGVNLGYSGDYAVVRNNKITNTGMFSGMGESGDNKGVAIFTSGNNSTIEYNQIINSGWVGICFNGNYVTIKNNLIDNFCMTKDDGAGIYTYVGSVNVNLKGRKLIGNIILNGQGVPEGVRGEATYPAEGIYLDNGASGVELTGNTIANCGNQGVYIHCAHEITMKNNTLFNNITRQLSVIGLAKHPKIRNCNISDNIFFARRDYQKLLYIRSDDDDTEYFGKFDDNYYARPSDDESDAYLQKLKEVEADAKLLSFSQDIRFEYNATKQTKKMALSAAYVDAKGNNYSGSVTLQPFTSIVLIKSNASQANTPPVVNITSPNNSKNFTRPATINIAADASDNDGSVSKVEFYSGKTLIATEKLAPYTYSWTDVANGTYSITAKATDNDGLVTTSDAVHITVGPDGAPVVSLTSPVSSTSYSGPATIKIKANARDDNGTIIKVEFYNGKTLLHKETAAPYTHTWDNVPNGTYSITARATDDDGNVTTSKAVVVTVAPARNGFANRANAASSSDILNNESLSLKLSPNPAQNILNISAAGFKQDEKVSISIISASGILIKTIQPGASLNQILQVDVSSFSNGIYFVKVVSGDKVLNQKFIKL